MTTTAFDDQFAADPSKPKTTRITIELDDPHTVAQLRTMATLLATQDNRCTSHPVFEVRKDIPFICDPEYCDEYYWEDDGGERVTDEALAEKLSKICEGQLDDQVELDGERYSQVFVQYAHETVAVFFTQAAADRFIRENQHNHRNSPRPLYVYISSGWRNPEWQLVREFLRSLNSATFTQE